MEFLQHLQVIEAEIQQKFGTNQQALMEAQERYKEEPDIAKLMLEMKMLLFGEQQFAEIQEAERQASLNMPTDMSPERFFALMQRHMSMLGAPPLSALPPRFSRARPHRRLSPIAQMASSSRSCRRRGARRPTPHSRSGRSTSTSCCSRASRSCRRASCPRRA